MGAIGGLLGTSGGVNGTGISGPNGAQIDHPATMQQANNAYSGVQQGLGAQEGLMRALEAQKGLQRQNSVYDQGQLLANQLSNTRAVGSIQDALNSQQALAQQYQGVANGTGPNPAQAMLANATGANVANQAALMAGQRGAGSNVGLMARQAAQQGAMTQQQAAGQAAEIQANQQLQAMGQMSGINQSAAGIGNSLVAAQQAQHNALAGQAGAMTANQMGATQGYSQAQQAGQGQILNSMGAQNNAEVGMRGNINSANAGLAGTQMQGQQGMIGGMMQAAGPALAGLMAAGGGMVPHMADGGIPIGPQSSFGQFVNGVAPPSAPEAQLTNPVGPEGAGTQQLKAGFKSLQPGGAAKPETGGGAAGVGGAPASKGGIAPLMAVVPKAEGGLAEGGGNVKAKSPDQKAVASGNSYANDKIPAMLSEGEIVIPRDVLQSSDPAAAAAAFVSQTLSKRSSGPAKMADGGLPPAEMPTEGPMPQGTPQDAAQPQESTPQAAPAPTSPQQADPMAMGPKGPEQLEQEMNEHDAKLQQDYAMGYIKPKTYADLMHDKSTLGKVGTFFGLLISGAGAGLTHQPNALMEMMNKEIERDLDRQKTDQSNRQNWYKMSLQHELQKHQQANIDAGTRSQNAAGLEHARAADLTGAKIKQLEGATGQKIDLSASNAAKNNMLIGYGQQAQDQVNKLPPGPTKAAGQATIDNSIKPAITKQVLTNNKNTAAKVHAITEKESSEIAPAVNVDKIQDAKQKNQIMSDNGLTPKISADQFSKMDNEAKMITDNRNDYRMWHKAFTKLLSAPDKGGIFKDLYAAETANLPDAVKGQFPSITDFLSGAAKEKYDNTEARFIANEASALNLKQVPGAVGKFERLPSPFKRENKKTDGGKGSEDRPKPTPGPSEGAYGYYNGKKYKYVNGKAVPQ